MSYTNWFQNTKGQTSKSNIKHQTSTKRFGYRGTHSEKENLFLSHQTLRSKDVTILLDSIRAVSRSILLIDLGAVVHDCDCSLALKDYAGLISVLICSGQLRIVLTLRALVQI